ncbi:trypsin-like peptidase domain-containing protein [Lysinibacillus sp. NPDC048646]|uniref:trypsin-like peptidase domain-containing protein n=1 Tax=Lysinibacillus sp. NPDC048646 TaxID=3390574 RepID=UPI003D03377F
MIVKTKSLKIQLKQTQNPLEDFVLINKSNHSSVRKEILFVRYIGIPNAIEHYIENIMSIDQYFTSNMSTTPYLRLHGLEPIADKDDIKRLSTIWNHWQTIVDNPITDSYSLYQTPLCGQLDNETLEWTKKITFIKILSMYKKTHPNSNATLLKNFVVKFLNWMEIYLPKLLEPTSISPKVVFIGDIKHHELLFLCFLSRLGCDICYMNPKEDIANLYPEIETYTTLYKCSTFYSAEVPIPEFIPAANKEHTLLPSKPHTISQSILANTTNQKHSLVDVGELSYVQLAGLSNSVVMIKVYDEENKILCGGSGVIIHSSGYILTNLHVVGVGHYYAVIYENETEEYLTDHFIKYHQLYDLAIIKVDKDCSPLPVKTENNLVRGQKIVAIGSPLGLFNSFSDGIVSGFRDIDNLPMIQFTAPISNGSSGGALLDMFGRLVGLITGGFDKGQNLNLAVPSDKIYEFAQNFIEHTN